MALLRCRLCFNTQPPEGGWWREEILKKIGEGFQHTAARRRLVIAMQHLTLNNAVSTHSRPKAAGNQTIKTINLWDCFNTQPPEGGWASTDEYSRTMPVSTHSRPKAAGSDLLICLCINGGFNTQPPEGGWVAVGLEVLIIAVSTHSRPKAAG